jgi:hypothetical protein
MVEAFVAASLLPLATAIVVMPAVRHVRVLSMGASLTVPRNRRRVHSFEDQLFLVFLQAVDAPAEKVRMTS